VLTGAVPPRREHRGERAHSEQLQPVGEAHQGVGASVRRHLSLFHGAVQVHGRRGRERVSINHSLPLFKSRFNIPHRITPQVLIPQHRTYSVIRTE
jgi:hypothetical protein